MIEKEEKLYTVPSTGEQIDLETYIDEKGRRLTPDGLEIPDPTPIAPPVGYVKQPSLVEQIRAMVRSEKLRQEAEGMGAGSFEEEDDFDVGDDYDPSSPYEADFEPMDPADRAALSSQGKNVDAIVPQKPSKKAKEAPEEPPASSDEEEAQ